MSLDINFITVQFYTTSDDKDDDTVVTCTVNKLTNGIPGPNLAAASGTWGGHLNDNSWSHAINLGYNGLGPWVSGEEYALIVTIDPNGHDTWRFDCQLAIKIQGENGRIYNFTGHALSQDVRSNTYPFIL